MAMEDFRSKSYRDERMQMESYYGRPNPSSMQDLRSYSVNYAQQQQQQQETKIGKEMMKMKKWKSINVVGSSNSSSNWSFINDPELQRKKRVAGYKVYTVEGKMKGSLRKSFRWVKNTCNHVVHGSWW